MILAVTGGKGGVGKSTVALNLGAELDAVVVDADLDMADLPSGRGPDLHDVLAGRADPLEAVDDSGPVTLLPCGRSLLGARACEPDRLVSTVEAVAEAYDRVVIDCPAGMSADAGLPLLAAERCVIVASPRAFALPDAIRTRALARELGAGLARVVLNKSGPGPTDGIARALGAPVTTVPESAGIERAQAHGLPVRKVAPTSIAAERFRAVADSLRA